MNSARGAVALFYGLVIIGVYYFMSASEGYQYDRTVMYIGFMIAMGLVLLMAELAIDSGRESPPPV